MKKLLLLTVIITLSLLGQTGHSVTLSWTDTANPSGTTYTVYRSAVSCSSFSKVISGISVMTFTDATVSPGPYCYYVTATSNGAESAPSLAVTVTVPNVAAPSGVKVTNVQ